ncbi:MAG: DUF1501 domain-containing protein, partial [Planctomycetaceae bacterium]
PGQPLEAAPADDRFATADQVVFLWLPGGVTHHESFDPKPQAPEEIRGPIQAIETSVSGVRFAETLPFLARHMDKLAVVRSFAAGTNDHFDGQAYALSGRNVLPNGILSEPNFGSVIHHQLGATGGLPGYIAVPGSTRPGPPNTDMFVPAWLGQEYAPFCTMGEPRNADFQVRDLGLLDGISAERFTRRQSLRLEVESRLATLEQPGVYEGMRQLYGRALDLMTSPRVREAFDLAREPATAWQKYGLSKVGQRCLLARRLIDADARFVMMDYGYDWGDYNNLWDNHCAPGQNQPHMWKMCKVPYHLPAVDQAFAALLDDLSLSGRLERTLVVYFTEFGRTPQINSNGGRDHWGYSGSIFYAGGGVQGGQVIGVTDTIGAYCKTRTYSPADAVATVYKAVGIDPHTAILDRQNRPLAIQTTGELIPVF